MYVPKIYLYIELQVIEQKIHKNPGLITCEWSSDRNM